jgi:Chloride channel protein EriC
MNARAADQARAWHACDNWRMTSPESAPRRMRHRLRPLLSHDGWKQRAVLWGGAVAVALVAIVFAKASDAAFHLFQRIVAHSPWWALLLTPSVFALLAWLTNGVLRPTRGSGIPQVIAALERPDDGFRQTNLSLRVSAGKLLLTTMALFGGASVGREGPTVHVGASLMYVLGRWFGFRDARQASHFLLAGGAAGIAAAFNTPLAGVVFAIEELSGRFEHRFSGTLLTAVIVGGVVSLGLLGNYTYFGKVSAALPLGRAWLAIALCGAVAGLLGGVFSRMVLATVAGRPRWLGTLRGRHPVLLPRCAAWRWSRWAWCSAPARSVPATSRRGSLVQGQASVGHEFGFE